MDVDHMDAGAACSANTGKSIKRPAIGGMPLNRKQSIEAARILHPLFDPVHGHKQWGMGKRLELVAMVNENFSSMEMDQSYTIKKLECWLGNTMVRAVFHCVINAVVQKPRSSDVTGFLETHINPRTYEDP